MLRQVSGSNWNRHYDAEPLCSLCFSVSDIESKFDIEFVQSSEEGLGQVFGAFCEINGHQLVLKGYDTKEDKKLGVVIEVQGNNPDPKNTIEEILSCFGIGLADLTWVRDDLTPPKWILFRQGDDGNEVEITRFHKEEVAEYVMKVFTNRGHKQIYFIRNIK